MIIVAYIQLYTGKSGEIRRNIWIIHDMDDRIAGHTNYL